MIFKALLMIAALVGTTVIGTQAAMAVGDRITAGPAGALTSEVARTHNSTGHLDGAYGLVVPPTPPVEGVTTPETADAVPEPSVPEDEQVLTMLREDLELSPTEHTLAVEEFYHEWDSRYHTARDAHRRLEWRVQMADRAAPRYFEAQKDLTRVMPNPERRRIYEERDAREEELYREWQIQAYRVVGQSSLLMEQLRQLDLEISKLRLSANFAALYQEFATIPVEVNQLHLELESFRARTRSLEQQLQAAGT